MTIRQHSALLGALFLVAGPLACASRLSATSDAGTTAPQPTPTDAMSPDGTGPADGAGRIDFAIYDEADEDDGVWEEEITALETTMSRHGFSFVRIGAKEINGGRLTVEAYRALVEPGGWAAYRNDKTLPEQVRTYVRSGGGYLELCAGMYNASNYTVWAFARRRGDENLASEYVPYPNETYVGLMGVSVYGPLGWYAWPPYPRQPDDPLLDEVLFDKTVPALMQAGLPASTRLFYAGGPFVHDETSLPAGTEVWARARAKQGASSSVGDGKPTILSIPYGQGRVIVSSYHPTILVGSSADGVVLKDYYDEASIDWHADANELARINLARTIHDRCDEASLGGGGGGPG